MKWLPFVLLMGCGVAPLTAGDLQALSPPPAVTLSGVVSDGASGAGLAGATVVVGTAMATSDAQGLYRLEGLVTGTQQGVVSAKGFVAYPFEVPLVAGTNRLDLALAAAHCGPCASGRVCDPETMACVPAASVSGIVVSACNGAPLHARVNVSGHVTCSRDLKSVYQLDGLELGAHTLAVGAAGYRPESRAVTLRSGQNPQPDVALTPVDGCASPPPAPTCTP